MCILMKGYFGIIGGLGPKATATFIYNIVDRTVAERDQDHPEFILFNHPTIPDRSAYILERSNPNPLPYLIKDVQKMSEFQVSFIVIPCNTAHFFYDELQSHSEVPIVHMIRETVSHITSSFPQYKKIGILGTPGTIKSNLYQNELQKAGLSSILPTEIIQEKVNELIFQKAKKGENIDDKAYLDVLRNMSELGCDTTIIGCTELSLIEHEAVPHYYPIVDAQAVLVEKTILLSGKQVKQDDTNKNALSSFK